MSHSTVHSSLVTSKQTRIGTRPESSRLCHLVSWRFVTIRDGFSWNSKRQHSTNVTAYFEPHGFGRRQWWIAERCEILVLTTSGTVPLLSSVVSANWSLNFMPQFVWLNCWLSHILRRWIRRRQRRDVKNRCKVHSRAIGWIFFFSLPRVRKNGNALAW